ncbi:uncharacterized protein LOC141902628 [Tubulanus polymorphus]|uniref:uncharacterized protein LOC141902628 n=1 Tax=Tubulanus polymorphus TaxID=672921 RepID=UPI003DA55C4F
MYVLPTTSILVQIGVILSAIVTFAQDSCDFEQAMRRYDECLEPLTQTIVSEVLPGELTLGKFKQFCVKSYNEQAIGCVNTEIGRCKQHRRHGNDLRQTMRAVKKVCSLLPFFWQEYEAKKTCMKNNDAATTACLNNYKTVIENANPNTNTDECGPVKNMFNCVKTALTPCGNTIITFQQRMITLLAITDVMLCPVQYVKIDAKKHKNNTNSLHPTSILGYFINIFIVLIVIRNGMI